MTKETKKTEADVAKALLGDASQHEAEVLADLPEPKVGKVEARIAALEGYIKRNAKTLGWPELD